jgi:hypothetical protein
MMFDVDATPGTAQQSRTAWRAGTGYGALAACVAAFVAALDWPWIRLPGGSGLFVYGALTGAGSLYAPAVFVLFLLAAPTMIGLALAARCRADLAAATIGIAVAVFVALLSLLHPVQTRLYGVSIVHPVPLTGFWVALAVPVFAAVAAAARLGPHRFARRWRFLALAFGAATAYGVALWLPGFDFDLPSNVDGGPTVTASLPFTGLGVAYLIVTTALFGLAAAAHRSGTWRVAALALGGAWAIVCLIVLVEPGDTFDSIPVTSHVRVGLYVCLLAVVLLCGAAWAAEPGKPRFSASRVCIGAWLAASVGLLAAMVIGWISFPQVTAVNIQSTHPYASILDNVNGEVAPAVITYLAGAPVLIAAVAAALVNPLNRWASTALGVGMIVMIIAISQSHHRFLVEAGHEMHGVTPAFGLWLAIAACALAILSPWLAPWAVETTIHERAGSQSRATSLRQVVASSALIGTVVAVIAAMQQPWVLVRLLESDETEFDGDILQSPIGLVFVVTALLLVVGAAATVLSRRHRAQWRAITASIAISAVFIGFFTWRIGPALGFDYMLVRAGGATYHWRPGWDLAVAAIALTLVTILVAPRRDSEHATASDRHTR